MNHQDPEELNDIRQELEDVLKVHREILNQEPRILRPLLEAQQAAKTKYERVTEARDWEGDPA